MKNRVFHPYQMVEKEFLNLGKKIKTTGLYGDLLFFFDQGNEPLLRSSNFIFFELPGDPVPFRVENFEISGNSARIKLRDISTIEQARVLTGYNLLLETKPGFQLKKKSHSQVNLEGYKVIDLKKGEIGSVQEVSDMGANIVIEVFNGFKTILIPYAEEIILGIDPKQKIVKIDAPEGLIDLYLNE